MVIKVLFCFGLLILGAMIGYDAGKKEGEGMMQDMILAVIGCHVSVAKKLIEKCDNPDYCRGYTQAVKDITDSFRPVKEGRKEDE